jgi:hypothetical protein
MRCPSCRAGNPAALACCSECGEPLPATTNSEEPPLVYPVAQAQADEVDIMDVLPAKKSADDVDDDEFSGDGGISTLIPYRNPKALAAYYLGLFSLIPVLGLVTAPFAVLFGVLGVRRARADKNAKGTIHAWIGIVFGLTPLVCVTALLCWVYSDGSPEEKKFPPPHKRMLREVFSGDFRILTGK